MAWKKIDDAQALPDMPYSSFLANGLTVNANSYNEDLRRGGGIAFNAHDSVTWSSYSEGRGFMFTVNLGQQVTQVDFRVTYKTLTNSVDADGFQGIVTIQHLTTGEFIQTGLLPNKNTAEYFDVSMPLSTPTSGPQVFSLTFRSSILENKGIVDIGGGVASIIYLDQRTGAGHYNITEGEKFELLDLTGVESPSAGIQETKYQMNYIATNAPPGNPDAYASVFPSLTTNPPRLRPVYNSSKIGNATVYELGAITLFGIAYSSVSANYNNAPPQLSHNSTVALSQVIGIQNRGRTQFQPDLCNGLSQRFSLGCVISSQNRYLSIDEVTTSFCFTTNSLVDYKTLSITFQVFALNTVSRNLISVTLLDDADNPVIPKQDVHFTPLRSRLPQSVAGITARGWYEPTAVAAWGMRDSMNQSEMTDGSVLTFNLRDVYLEAGKIWTVKIQAGEEGAVFYLFNVYARIIENQGDM